MPEHIKELIKRRRSQMLVHSCIYYEFDQIVVSDDIWQKWANELAELQRKHPECCEINFFDKEFKGWNGDTGYHLPLRHPWLQQKAEDVLDIHKQTTKEKNK